MDLAGHVTKIWSRSTGDVFARIDTGATDAEKELDTIPNQVDPRLTLRLPGGQVGGRDVSLLKGDALHITGYLDDLPQWETLRDFLLKAREEELVKRIPELLAASSAQVKRSVTCVVPETLELLDPARFSPASFARVDGVVARVWEYGGHLFLRLAVYDRHTASTPAAGNHGRERRTPHYVTVQFLDQRVDGRAVILKLKDRIRVSGSLGSRIYSENLRSFLIAAHQASVLANLSDGQAPDEVWAAYAQTCLVAQKLIQYTKR